MNLLSRFYILKTASSEVNKRTLFKQRCTTHVPDLFFVFTFATSFFAAQSFDKVLTVLIFFFGHSLIGACVFGAFALLPFAFLFWFENNHEDCIPGYTMRTWCSTILILVGCGPFIICGNALKNTFENRNELNIPLKCHSIPIFHIKHNDMCLMKIYYIFNVAVKCIPQFYIVSVLIKKRYLTGALAIFGQVSLLINMIMFSLTVAMTFPLRSTPRIYTTSLCILLNAFCKFMATLCGCGINLAIFTMLFSGIGYYALLTQTIKSLLWVWPSWWVLKTQPHVLSRVSFILYLFLLTLIFSFIYIHPFEGKGKLVYYFFYLMKFFSEIFCIYIFTDARGESVAIYFTLKIVMIGYLSCYGLINILHKYKYAKFGCEVDSELQQKRKNEKKNYNRQQKKKERRDKLQTHMVKSKIAKLENTEEENSKIEEKQTFKVKKKPRDMSKKISETDPEAGTSKYERD